MKAHDFGSRPVRLLRFSRNFGKEAALSAGIDAAEGADAAILMDADLQHPPEMIADFVRIWQEEDADSVYAYKASRLASEGPVKAALSRAFFWVINRDQRYKIPPGAGGFRLVNRRFMAALRSLPESDRFMKGLYGWVGFNQSRPSSPAASPYAGYQLLQSAPAIIDVAWRNDQFLDNAPAPHGIGRYCRGRPQRCIWPLCPVGIFLLPRRSGWRLPRFWH